MNVVRIIFFALSNADKFLEAANQVKEFVEWLQKSYGGENQRTEVSTDSSVFIDTVASQFPVVAELCDGCGDVRTRETAFNGRRGALGDLIRWVLKDPERVLHIINTLIDLFNSPSENFGLQEGDE